MHAIGTVYLVGAGPGDPDLLTVKAQRLLREASVVVYDRLVSEQVLALVPQGIARLYVGKTAGTHVVPQHEINELVANLALAGRDVVRLKGGDPFVFGRGGEEALYLHERGVPFEVVPGITAAVACAAYAGIPVTHRGVASGVHLLTGHCRGTLPLELDWHTLADPQTTLVVYMGLANLRRIRDGLLAAGRDGATPVAVIADGTLASQRRLLTTLGRMVADAARRDQLVHLLRHDCGSCHGLTLAGGLGPPLTAHALRDRPAPALEAAILHGRPGTPMPPWRGLLSAAEVSWMVRWLQRGEAR